MLPASRRHFLKHVASASVALSSGAVCLPKVFAAEDKGSRMKLGLVTYQWAKDWDLPTLIANCEKAQVLGVELRTTHAHGVEPSLNAAQRKEVKKRFDDSPVTNVGLGSNERFDDPNPKVLKKAIQATQAFVKLSHDLGSSGVKVKPNSFHKGVPRERTIQQIGKSLNQVGRFAADYGQQIRLEVHGQCAELPTIKAIMDIADHPSVAICWNSNAQDLQGQGLEHNFNLVKDRFGSTCHIRPLDAKNYPYEKLIKLLVEMDYAGWMMIEDGRIPENPVAELIRNRQLLRRLVKQSQG